MWIKVQAVAKICHEANKAYCEGIGDSSQPTWDQAPEWQKASAENGVRFHLEGLENGDTPSPSASHESWLKQKTEEGWKYGEVKDSDKKEHPCFTAYENLPKEQRAKDYIFAAIVEALFDAKMLS